MSSCEVVAWPVPVEAVPVGVSPEIPVVVAVVATGGGQGSEMHVVLSPLYVPFLASHCS